MFHDLWWQWLLLRGVGQQAHTRPSRVPMVEQLDERVLPSGSAPHIMTNPADLTVDTRHMATFTAAATGASKVKWEVSKDAGKTFQDFPGATSPTLSFLATAAENGDQFEAIFTNAAGKAVTSTGTLTVNFAPQITSQPSSQVVATGSQVTLKATANSNPAATVQWQLSTDGGKTFKDVTGATSATYVFAAPTSPGIEEFRAVFTNALGKATTKIAVVTVDAPATVTVNPASVTAKAGQMVTFTASAAGQPAPSVQWQVSKDGGKTFTNVPKGRSNTLSFTATKADDGNQYRAIFTNAISTANTSLATLAVG
jgi:hypothetical protein